MGTRTRLVFGSCGGLGLLLSLAACDPLSVADEPDEAEASRILNTLLPQDALLVRERPGLCDGYQCPRLTFRLPGLDQQERLAIVSARAKESGWKVSVANVGDGGTGLSLSRGDWAGRASVKTERFVQRCAFDRVKDEACEGDSLLVEWRP